MTTSFPKLIRADQLHSENVTGRGVTIAVVDTGFWPIGELDSDTQGNPRVVTHDTRLKQKRSFSWEDHDVRVVNLSFSTEPVSHYWDAPLNQAVMALWNAGIVVVASTENGGPDPMTIGVPGNVPYVITVGAMTDSYTPDDGSDDVSASFSSAGTTVEGRARPGLQRLGACAAQSWHMPAKA